MAARSLIVPKFSADDPHGTFFAERADEAFEYLQRHGYEKLKVTELTDDDGKVTACCVTGQLSVDGNPMK